MPFIDIILWMIIFVAFFLIQIIMLIVEDVKKAYSKISGALRKLVSWI